MRLSSYLIITFLVLVVVALEIYIFKTNFVKSLLFNIFVLVCIFSCILATRLTEDKL